MATIEERLGEISPQTVDAVAQAMARARAADGAGDKNDASRRSPTRNARSVLDWNLGGPGRSLPGRFSKFVQAGGPLLMLWTSPRPGT